MKKTLEKNISPPQENISWLSFLIKIKNFPSKFDNYSNYIFIIILLCLSSYSTVTIYGDVDDSSMGNSDEIFLFSKPILSIETDNGKYLSGQVIVISGNAFNDKGESNEAKIFLDIYKNSDMNESIYSASLLTKDGKFRHTGATIEELGKYTIQSRVESGNKEEHASTSFQVVKFPDTRTGKGILISMTFFGLLLTLIFFQSRCAGVFANTEPLRFGLLTLISILPVIIFISADVQLGQDGPIGLVTMQTSSNLDMDTKFEGQTSEMISFSGKAETIIDETTEWVINIGGSVRDNYRSGIQVPVFVFIFGMMGGYLRFLRKTAVGWFRESVKNALQSLDIFSNEKELNEEVKEIIEHHVVETDKKKYVRPILRHVIFNNSMEDLALLFLSPILAMATYFVSIQAGLNPENDMATIAAISFGVGLITNDALSRLEAVASSMSEVQRSNKEK